ncbi:MAG TPA: protein-export chaperone SecB [Alphaproteobacteria bacterium]|nr:protein-export chaperone SecB [Rhodospirillaceae bacterium]HRJ11645.1 protein-export chaperone SecB [Alphaproteobacteria bacterium]
MSQPMITQTGQYLKDLSFENFLGNTQFNTMPGVDLNVDLGVRPQQEPVIADGKVTCEYEVILTIRAAARPMGKDGAPPTDEDKILFMAEVAYAGRYQLTDVPQAEVEPFLLIEAPRLLFPFVRQIAADAVMQGGLPPLLMAPIDFVQLYQQRKAQQKPN